MLGISYYHQNAEPLAGDFQLHSLRIHLWLYEFKYKYFTWICLHLIGKGHLGLLESDLYEMSLVRDESEISITRVGGFLTPGVGGIIELAGAKISATGDGVEDIVALLLSSGVEDGMYSTVADTVEVGFVWVWVSGSGEGSGDAGEESCLVGERG